jgi:hypothetical protein
MGADSIMLNGIDVPALLALAALLMLDVSAVFADTDRQTRVLPLPPDRTLSLEMTVGDLRIEGGTRSDVLVEVVRHAPTADGLTRLPLEIVEAEGEVRIRVVQADEATDPAYRSNITLRVPRQAIIRSVRMLEGRLTIAGLSGSIDADVRRGSITASGLEGTVRLETGIGDVTADRMRLSPGGLLRLRAFNGDVRLTLAVRPTDARVLALALNGTIRSDIPLRTKDTWGPRWAEATLGAGEPVISIDVITGRIEIRVRPRA